MYPKFGLDESWILSKITIPLFRSFRVKFELSPAENEIGSRDSIVANLESTAWRHLSMAQTPAGPCGPRWPGGPFGPIGPCPDRLRFVLIKM